MLRAFSSRTADGRARTNGWTVPYAGVPAVHGRMIHASSVKRQGKSRDRAGCTPGQPGPRRQRAMDAAGQARQADPRRIADEGRDQGGDLKGHNKR